MILLALSGTREAISAGKQHTARLNFHQTAFMPLGILSAVPSVKTYLRCLGCSNLGFKLHIFPCKHSIILSTICQMYFALRLRLAEFPSADSKNTHSRGKKRDSRDAGEPTKHI